MRVGRHRVELTAPTEIIGGIDEVHCHHRVCHGWLRASTGIANRTRVRAGACWTNLRDAPTVEPDDASTARADTYDVDGG